MRLQESRSVSHGRSKFHGPNRKNAELGIVRVPWGSNGNAVEEAIGGRRRAEDCAPYQAGESKEKRSAPREERKAEWADTPV